MTRLLALRFAVCDHREVTLLPENIYTEPRFVA